MQWRKNERMKALQSSFVITCDLRTGNLSIIRWLAKGPGSPILDTNQPLDRSWSSRSTGRWLTRLSVASFHRVRGYLLSRTASLSFGQYQIRLLTDVHVREQLAQGCHLTAQRPGVEDGTCGLQVLRQNHQTTLAHSSSGSYFQMLAVKAVVTSTDTLPWTETENYYFFLLLWVTINQHIIAYTVGSLRDGGVFRCRRRQLYGRFVRQSYKKLTVQHYVSPKNSLS